MEIVNFFKQAIKNFKIIIIDVTSLFEGKEDIIFENNFKDNQNKELSIKFPKEPFLIRIEIGKKIYEKLILNSQEKIRIPILFFKDYRLSKNEVFRIAEKYRWDRLKCYQCKMKYTDYLEVYECHYCNRIYCSKHRVPEYHNCKSPKKPEEFMKGLGGRMTFSGNKTKYYTE